MKVCLSAWKSTTTWPDESTRAQKYMSFALFPLPGRPRLSFNHACRAASKSDLSISAVRSGTANNGASAGLSFRTDRYLRRVTAKGHKIVAPAFAVRSQNLDGGLVQVGQQETE